MATAAAATQPATRTRPPTQAPNPFEPHAGRVFVATAAVMACRPWQRRSTCGSALTALPARSRINVLIQRTRMTTLTNATRSPSRSSQFLRPGRAYGPRDRDIRHKVNFFTYVELPRQFLVTFACRADGTAITTSPRGAERRRSRTELGPEGQQVLLARLAPAASVPVRAARPGDSSFEMFNTFNNANNVNRSRRRRSSTSMASSARASATHARRSWRSR